MKLFKRGIAFICAAGIMLCAGVNAQNAEAYNDESGDTEEILVYDDKSDYTPGSTATGETEDGKSDNGGESGKTDKVPINENILLAEKFSVFEGTEIKAQEGESLIKRQDFAVIISNIFKLSKLSVDETGFSDVLPTDYAAGAIKALSLAGVMTGSGNGEFMPEKTVSCAEAAKVITALLGYNDMALNSGGYPSGYLMAAKKIGVIGGGFNISENLTVLTVSDIFANILEVKPMQLISIVNNNMKFQISGGESFMESYYSVYKKFGTVDAVYKSSLGGAGSVQRNEVSIDKTVYKAGDSGAEGLFANSVKFYYKTDKTQSKATIIFITKTDDAKTLTFSGDDAVFTGNEYTYYSGDKKKTAKISAAAEIFYNGKKIKYNKRIMVPQNGEVTLVDNSSAEGYDAVIIKDYALAVAETVNVEDKKLFFKDDTVFYRDENLNTKSVKSVLLDEEDDMLCKIYNSGGEVCNIEDVVAGMIVSVAASVDFDVVEVRCSGESVSGEITKVGKDKITVGEKEYETAGSILNRDLIYAGANGIYCLDFMGRVVYIKGQMSSEQRGFLIRAALTGKGLEKTAKALFVNVDKKSWEEFVLADKVTVDGNSYKTQNQTELESLVRATRRQFVASNTNLVSYQLVYIKLSGGSENGSGEINSIYTVASDKYENFRVVNPGSEGWKDEMVCVNLGSVGDKALFNESTKFMFMPYAPATDEQLLNNAMNYIFFRDKWMLSDTAVGERLDLYYVEESDVASMLLRYGVNLKSISSELLSDAKDGDMIIQPGYTENIGMVKEINSVIDENGNRTEVVTFIKADGKDTEYKTNTRYSYASSGIGSLGGEELEVGDVFGYAHSGEIVGNFCKVYDADAANVQSAFLGAPIGYWDTWNNKTRYAVDQTTFTSGVTYDKNGRRFTAGRVYEIKDGVVKIARGDTTDESNYAVFNLGSQPVIICDSQRNNENVFVGSAEDIKSIVHYGADEASRIVVYTKDKKPVCVFIYN